MHISTAHAVDNQAPAASQARQAQVTPPTREAERQANPNAEDSRPTKSVAPAGDAARLSEAELRQIQELKTRDREVRAHEHAHLAVGGSLTRGGATYTYERGPDGKRYAVGGEVHLESARVAGDPETTVARAEHIQHAATAPANPSAQDRAVATQEKAEAKPQATAQDRVASRADEVDAPRDDPGQVARPTNDNGIQAEMTGERSATSDSPTESGDSPPSSEISLYERVASQEEQHSSGHDDFQSMKI